MNRQLLAGIVALASACASTGDKRPSCNPVMVRCNPADYPPLTELLPKSPIPPPLSSWHDVPAAE